jgi:hypothetical protein
VPKSEVRLSVPERGLPELLKEPVGVPVRAGRDTFKDVMIPLETVVSDGYGAGPLSEGKASVAGNDVESDSVPDLGLPELLKPAPAVLVTPGISPPAPEPWPPVLKTPPVPPVLRTTVTSVMVLVIGAGVSIAPDPTAPVSPEVPLISIPSDTT